MGAKATGGLKITVQLAFKCKEAILITQVDPVGSQGSLIMQEGGRRARPGKQHVKNTCLIVAVFEDDRRLCPVNEDGF